MTADTSASDEVVLITGGAGFVGSHLAEAVLSSGRRVRVIDDLSTGRERNIAHLARHPRFTFHRGRLEDDAALNELAEGAGVVFHLAAAVGVSLVMQEPARAIETNVSGAQCVLRAARRHGNRVLITSSSEVYGRGTAVPFQEDQDVRLGPPRASRWSYAVSKLVEEHLALANHRQYGLEVVVARLFNTVGTRQTGRYGMVVPRFVRQALEGRPITVYGDGTQTRSFCDVRDVVDCLLGLAGQGEAIGRVFNVGSRTEISIRDLAGRIRRLTGSASETVHIPYDEAYGDSFEDLRRRVPDTSRAEDLLGWRPRRSLDETLMAVVDFERQRAARVGRGAARAVSVSGTGPAAAGAGEPGG